MCPEMTLFEMTPEFGIAHEPKKRVGSSRPGISNFI